jgi:hypothetical protein
VARAVGERDGVFLGCKHGIIAMRWRRRGRASINLSSIAA